MKVTRRRILQVVFGGLAALAVVCGLATLLYIRAGRRELRDKCLQLFSKTDYQALLQACRELSARFSRGDLELGRYNVRPYDGERWLQLPPVIMQLDPSFVDIDQEGRVHIDLGFGNVRFGVTAYPENYEVPFSGFVYGEIEFIPGLWYYDADYRLNPDHRRHIDALIGKTDRPTGGTTTGN